MTENVPAERGIIGTRTTSAVALGVAVEPTTPETAVLVEAVVEKTKGRIIVIVRVMRRDEGDASAAELDQKKLKFGPRKSKFQKRRKNIKRQVVLLGMMNLKIF